MSGLPHGGAPLLTAETADAAVQQRRAEMLSRVDVASRAQQQLAQLRVNERSPRADIDVVVSGRGTLLELTLGASTSRMSPSELAAEIVATVQRACAEAGTRTLALVEQALPAGVDLAGAVRDPALPLGQPSPVNHRLAESTEPESWLRPAYDRGPR